MSPWLMGSVQSSDDSPRPANTRRANCYTRSAYLDIRLNLGSTRLSSIWTAGQTGTHGRHPIKTLSNLVSNFTGTFL